MIRISHGVSVFDPKNVPDTGARLVVQPDYSNAAFRTEPTFQQDFPDAATALDFLIGNIGKAVFGTPDNQHVANIITGGVFYIDIITADAIRKSFRIESTQRSCIALED